MYIVQCTLKYVEKEAHSKSMRPDRFPIVTYDFGSAPSLVQKSTSIKQDNCYKFQPLDVLLHFPKNGPLHDIVTLFLTYTNTPQMFETLFIEIQNVQNTYGESNPELKLNQAI